MKIKGEYKIELRDAKTGKVTDTRIGHNFVTGFWNEFAKNIGLLNPNIFVQRNTNNLVDDLFGGIMCFDSAITENTDMTGNYDHPLYAPASKEMTANGCIDYTTSSALVTELGAYNASESVTSNGRSRRYVYDWDTNEGNGVIGCVCLSSKYGGYRGNGNYTSRNTLNSGQQSPNIFDGAFEPIQKQVQANTDTSNGVSTLDANGTSNTIAYINVSRSVIAVITDFRPADGVVTIEEYALPSKRVNVLGSNGNVVSGNKVLVNTRTYTFTPITDATNIVKTGCGYGYWYIITNSNIASTDNVVNVLKFNIDNTQQQFRFVHRLSTWGQANQNSFQVEFMGNYMVLFNSSYMENSAIFLYNIATDTCTEYINAGLDQFKARSYRSCCFSSYHEGVWSAGKFNLRLVNGEPLILPVNSHWLAVPYRGNTARANGCGIDDPYYHWWQDNQDGCIYSLGTLTREYLATIANLSQPVVKTADKTMKITYTLTLQED